MSAELQGIHDQISDERRLYDAGTLAEREHCAALVEQMVDQAPWKDHQMARVALTLAAHVIRRGRHLTAKEKLANLRKALNEE